MLSFVPCYRIPVVSIDAKGSVREIGQVDPLPGLVDPHVVYEAVIAVLPGDSVEKPSFGVIAIKVGTYPLDIHDENIVVCESDTCNVGQTTAVILFQ